MSYEKAVKLILRVAAKHEVQYWLDEPGTDAEKLAKIVRICRHFLDTNRDRSHEGVRLISMRDIPREGAARG